MFFLWSDSYLRDGDADQREILHDRTYRFRTLLLPFWGRYSRGVPKVQNFGPLKRENLENCKSQRYMCLKSARREHT